MSLMAKHPRNAEDYPSALEVAREFFALAKAEDSPQFTSFKLEKLIYYAQATSLHDRGRPLFHESVRAWDHGPVVACVWHEVKGMRVIPYSHESLNRNPELSGADKQFILSIWERFKHLSGDELSDRTHESGKAYERARARKSIVNRNPPIRREEMISDVDRERDEVSEQFSAFLSGLRAH